MSGKRVEGVTGLERWRYGLIVRACAWLTAACCLVMLCGSFPAAAAAEISHGYTVTNNVFFLESGVQVIGYVPEEMAAETEGLLRSDALETYAWAGYDEAYHRREPLNEVVLPSSLQVIGECAFVEIHADRLRWPEQINRVMDRALLDSYLEEITFHAGVTEYSQYSFCGCEGTRAFIVEEGNPALKAVDGVLYTADGKTLLRYPPQKAGGHFDVPAGVEWIADYAFDGCGELHSISLPMGVKSIGWSAFGECIQLRSVAVPLTLREIQPYAFSDCINLSAIQLPQGVQVVCDPEIVAERNQWEGEEWRPEEYVFFNTPKLKDYPDWDWHKMLEANSSASDSPDEVGPALDYQEIWPVIPAILNPENARDLVKIYAEANEESKVLGSFACGSTVEVAGWKEGWYLVWWRRDCDEGAPEGWVREEDLLLCPSGEPLFQIASIRLKNSSVEYLNNGLCVLPYSQPKGRLDEDTPVYFHSLDGQWVTATYHHNEWGYGIIYFYPSDLLYTRLYTGDDLRFGMVISDDARDRLNLRAKPDRGSESIGKYFSGTQVEILAEQGDWYKVRVDFQEGWMMKEYVREVPQEEPASNR